MAEDDLEQRLRKGRLVREAETIHIEGIGKSSTGEVREFAHPDAIEAADRLKRYREALEGILDRYVGLVNCGDCGFWNPEEEAEVIAARQVLRGGA